MNVSKTVQEICKALGSGKAIIYGIRYEKKRRPNERNLWKKKISRTVTSKKVVCYREMFLESLYKLLEDIDFCFEKEESYVNGVVASIFGVDYSCD